MPSPTSIRRLAVFPGDKLSTLYAKGEIKARYYNPLNYFQEVHFFTYTDHDIEPENVQAVAGKAKIFIHPLGPLAIHSPLTKRKVVLDALKKVNPSVVRAYTPSIQGYLGIWAAKRLGIPSVLSLHADPDRDIRYLAWKGKRYGEWLRSTFSKFAAERYAVRNADRVICAYRFPVRYAKEYGAKDPIVIYNKVYSERFKGVKPALRLDKPAVITVGRLIHIKTPENLIRAMQWIDGYLIVVGDGPLYSPLNELAHKLGVGSKVRFFRAIQNKDLPAYYLSADVFAQSNRMGGVSIPIIEAMAAGLPLVISRSDLEPEPEVSSEAGIVVEDNSQAFAAAINRLIGDRRLRTAVIAKGKAKFKEIEGDKMEARERDVYRDLLGHR